mgnify:CR=1 FL=1
MNKKIFLCGTLVAGICLTNGCRSYHGYREFSTTEDIGIENKKLISQRKELSRDLGKIIQLSLFQDFRYTQKNKIKTYEEYIYSESSGIEFVADFIWSPVTLAVQIAFSPFILLATKSSDIEYNGHTYHYSFGRRYWNTFNPFLKYDYKSQESKIAGTELFKKDEEVQKYTKATTEIHRQYGTTVYAQYEGLKTPIAMKVPFTDAELAKQIFKYALPAQTKDVTITGDMGAKLELSIDSTSSLAANERNAWKEMTSGSTKEIFDSLHEFLAQLKKWKESSVISAETEAETAKDIIAKSGEYITSDFKKFCETNSCSDAEFHSKKASLKKYLDEKLISPETEQKLTAKLMENVKKYIHEKIAKTDISNFSIADFKNLKAEIDKYSKDGLISEKEKTELALSLSPKIEKKLDACKPAFIAKNLSALLNEINTYQELGFIASKKSFSEKLQKIAKDQNERTIKLVYPLYGRYVPQNLYKGYKSGYSLAYRNYQRLFDCDALAKYYSGEEDTKTTKAVLFCWNGIRKLIYDSDIKTQNMLGKPYIKLYPGEIIWWEDKNSSLYDYITLLYNDDTKRIWISHSRNVELPDKSCYAWSSDTKITTDLYDNTEGIFAYLPSIQDAVLIAAWIKRENASVADLEKKFQADYPNLKRYTEKRHDDDRFKQTPLHIKGTRNVIYLTNDNVEIRILPMQVADAEMVVPEMIWPDMETDKEACKEKIEQLRNEKRILILICDTKLLDIASEECVKFNKAKETRLKNQDLDF